MASNYEGAGASVRRREDFRFIKGVGNYVSDFHRKDDYKAFFVRSEHACARLISFDASAAAAADGVIAVFTGRDLLRDGVGNLPGSRVLIGADGNANKTAARFPLAIDNVKHVGDPVAVVIAETLYQAQDAAELIHIEWEVLDAVADSVAAAEPSAQLVWPELEDNVCCNWEIGDSERAGKGLLSASHIVELTLRNNRLACNPIEPRAARAEWSPSDARYTLYTTSQNPHLVKSMICNGVLPISEHQLRVIAPDVGGGFGSKLFLYPEEVVVTWVAGKIRHPVSWVASRSEALVSDIQARDHFTTAKLGLDDKGNFVALMVKTIANVGAYLSQGGTEIPTYYYAPLLSGVYRIPAIHCAVDLVFTNTTSVDAYRGAGRPEATYVLERLVDKAALQLGIDRLEIRRSNFIAENEFPYVTPLGIVYDSGHHHGTLREALSAADYPGFADRASKSEARGLLRGLGFSTYLEIAGGCPSPVSVSQPAADANMEIAEIRISQSSMVQVHCGTHSQGQGHETAFPQLVASAFGIPLDKVVLREGDTDLIVYGRGASASRSLVIGGSAILKAAEKVILKGKKIAAHVLAVPLVDISFDDGTFRAEGSSATLPFGDMVKHAYSATVPGVEAGLTETAYYQPSNWTYPGGCHVCEVEVDPETGVVSVQSVVACDDVGVVINPMIVDGQIHGGLAQGIGQALCEEVVYDSSSQPLCGSFMDYAMPRADSLPSFNVSTYEAICDHNPVGAKGCAEVGTVGIPPAVVNAVLDALRPLGVTELDMPLTPLKVWSAISTARTSAQAAQSRI